MNDEILSPTEISKLFKVSKPWPYIMAKRGLLPYHRMGWSEKRQIIRFRRSDVEEFFERGRVEKKK